MRIRRNYAVALALTLVAGANLHDPREAAALTGSAPLVRDCTIANDGSSVDRCERSDLQVGIETYKVKVCTDACVYETRWHSTRALIKFDLSTVPKGARIDSARLRLTTSSRSGNSQAKIAAYELYGSWDNSTTWTNPFTVAGGELGTKYVETPYNSASATYDWPLRDAAQRWADDPDENNGVALIATDEPEANVGSSQLKTASSESVDVSRRPRLEYTYTPDATPPGPPSVLRARVDGTSGPSTVEWYPSADPLRSDDTPTPGVAYYRYRYKVGASTSWSAWAQTDSPGFSVPTVAAGSSLNVELVPVDYAGNAGSTTALQTVFGRSYAQEVLADNPASYWRLSEAPGATVAADRMGRVNGRYVNGPELGVLGLVGNDADTAMRLTTPQSGVDLGNSYGFEGTSPFTAEILVSAKEAVDPDASSCASAPFGSSCSHEYLFDKLVGLYGVDRRGWGLSLRGDGRLEFQRWANNVGSVATSTAVLASDEPYLVQATFDGQKMRLYMNGALESEISATAGNLPMSTYPLLIGETTVESRLSIPYGGTLDEAALYPAALTALRIAAHASAVERDLDDIAYQVIPPRVFVQPNQFVPVEPRTDYVHFSRSQPGYLHAHGWWWYSNKNYPNKDKEARATVRVWIDQRTRRRGWKQVAVQEGRVRYGPGSRKWVTVAAQCPFPDWGRNFKYRAKASIVDIDSSVGISVIDQL